MIGRPGSSAASLGRLASHAFSSASLRYAGAAVFAFRIPGHVIPSHGPIAAVIVIPANARIKSGGVNPRRKAQAGQRN